MAQKGDINMKQKYMTTSEAAEKWNISQCDISKASREGYVDEAFKNEKGIWQIPLNAKNPFCDSKSSKISNKKENIIAVGIMITIVVISLITIGIDPIKQWLTEPIVWKDADFVNVELINKEEVVEDNLSLQFAIENTSEKLLDEYKFICYVGSVSFELSSIYDDINAYDVIVIDKTITTNGIGLGLDKIKVDTNTYNNIKNSDLENLDFSYKIKNLSSKGKTLVKNNGIFKDILILALSFCLGVLGFADIIKFSWLRILFKVCSLPAIILMFLIMFVFAIFGSRRDSQTQSDLDNHIKRNAAQNYKREANLKAGSVMTGNQKEAASSQARMDKNMADMITGSKSSIAKTNYKRAADAKAGFIRTGNQKEAAKAQALMDRYLADMISESRDE